MGRAELPGIGVSGHSTGVGGREGMGLQTTKGMGDPDQDLLAASSILSCLVMVSNIQLYL